MSSLRPQMLQPISRARPVLRVIQGGLSTGGQGHLPLCLAGQIARRQAAAGCRACLSTTRLAVGGGGGRYEGSFPPMPPLGPSPGSRAPPGPVGQENKNPICEQFCTDSLPRALLLAPVRDLCWGAANVYICRVSNAGGRETSAGETRQPTSEPSHCRRRSLALPR
jgi:hypothetical protein